MSMTMFLQVLLFQGPCATAHMPASLTVASPLQPGLQFVAYYPADDDSDALCSSVQSAVSGCIPPDSFVLEHASHCSNVIYILILTASPKAASVGHIFDALRRPGPTGAPTVTISDANHNVYEVKEEGRSSLYCILCCKNMQAVQH